VVTTPGVFGYPTSSGSVTGGEVETGDTGDPTLESAVYGVFDIETDPVYAEQQVQFSWDQLQSRCGALKRWAILPADGLEIETASPLPAPIPTITLDDDGNAVIGFVGTSCAAGSSVVTADVEAGTHPTYTTTFNILPPQVTI
jgi:hypothetical protein